MCETSTRTFTCMLVLLMKHVLAILVTFCLLSFGPLGAADPPAQRYDLARRASEIDERCREHPAIGFVFQDAQGKVLDRQHAVVDTRVPAQGKLVIWLMDHNAGLFERISSYGLHGIQVSYANRWFSGLTKEQLNDGQSLGKIRLEAATGEDHSPIVAIPQPDGMAERALQFVKWLAKENPPGKWEQFLGEGGQSLRWDKVILSGISHGSTTAARFAIHQKVDRVVMFSGPRDNTETWQGLPSATPANRFFGFTHVLDGGWTTDHYCRSWRLLKMHEYGPIVNVDETAPPYGDTRRLISTSDVKHDAGRAHTTVVPGGSAGKDAQGRFIHEPVWRYMFTHPVEKFGAAVVEDDCVNRTLVEAAGAPSPKPVATTTLKPNVLPAPIAHWKLDDDGREARDSAGAHHGVIHGATSQEGKFGKALHFDRAKMQHVSIPHSPDFELGTFTVSAWVWLTKEPTFSGILGTRTGGEFNFDMKVNTDKVHGDIGDGARWIETKVNFYKDDVGSDGQGGDLALRRWYLVTFVVDEARKECRLYLDADRKKSIPFAGSPRLMRAGQTMTIGDTGRGEHMDGVIDDVRIWKEALTDDQVKKLLP